MSKKRQTPLRRIKDKYMEKRNAKGQTLREFLAAYNPSDFVKPAVTADCLIFTRGGEKVLVVKRGNHPCIGEYALPGGFCETGESSEETARRELKEETGAAIDNLSQMYFVSTPNRDARDWIMTVCYIAAVDEPFAVAGGDDAADAVWLNVSAKYNGNRATLTLGDASAEFDIKRTCGKIDINNTAITKNTGIAFDHAKLILYGLEEVSRNNS